MFDEHRVLSHTAAVWLGTPLAAWQPITDQCTQQGGICRGEAGELPPHLTFPPTGLSENLGEWKGGVEGKGRVRETTCLTPPPLASASNIPPWYAGTGAYAQLCTAVCLRLEKQRSFSCLLNFCVLELAIGIRVG